MMKSIRRLALGLLSLALLSGVGPHASAAVVEAISPAREASAGAPGSQVQTPSGAYAQAAPSPQLDQLRDDIAQLVRSAASRGSQMAVLVVSLDRGDTLFSLNPDLPVAPASNMKLFTTAAALYYLGPNFRYSTYALADGEVREGVLEGDLILYGTGDPAMSSRMLSRALTPLQALADSLAAAGIRRVRGDIVGDGSYFDDQWIADGWRESYRLDSYSAPIGALSLAENVVSIRVSPGAAAGQPARITSTPATDGLLVQNRVRTVSSGSSSVRFAYHPDGLIIEGQLRRNHPGVARSVTVVDPANFAAAAFRRVLESAGISVEGEVRTVRSASESPVGRAAHPGVDGSRPPPTVLGTHLSPTLEEVVTVTNHVSQNLFAEAMFKTVGRVALGEGSFAGGSRAVQYFLECEKPIDFSNITIVDGSGLSPLNRVTARATIHLLDLMRRTDVWETFHASLPLAATPSGGVSHSLRNRMGGTAAARNLRAKTGTIASVSSLSGYVSAANGELIAFTIYGNELPSTWQSKRMEDAIGSRLARFSRPDPSPVASVAVTSPIDTAAVAAELSEAAPVTVQASPVGAASPRTHTVRSGETLDAIARRYRTTVTALEELNPRVRPRTLQIGQSITLPAE